MGPEEFAGWRDSHATQRIFQYLEKRRAENLDVAMNALAKMAMDNAAPHSRALFYAGVNAGINELLELTYDLLKED